MRLYLFFSHRLTPEQEEDARKSLGVTEFVYLPPHLQELFSNVPADLEDLGGYVRPFVDYLLGHSRSGEYILLQGEFGLVYRLIETSRAIGLVPVYATTKRTVVEEIKDGQVVKVSRFEHVRFRKY